MALGWKWHSLFVPNLPSHDASDASMRMVSFEFSAAMPINDGITIDAKPSKRLLLKLIKFFMTATMTWKRERVEEIRVISCQPAHRLDGENLVFALLTWGVSRLMVLTLCICPPNGPPRSGTSSIILAIILRAYFVLNKLNIFVLQTMRVQLTFYVDM